MSGPVLPSLPFPSTEEMLRRYPEVEPFTRAMLCELWANRGKGDQAAWRNDHPKELLGEVLYHAGKLAVAIKSGDPERIIEHAADVANMAMMVADATGAL